MTGCLPSALDKGTRIVQVLLTAGKEYICIMYLHKKVEQKLFDQTFKKFIGRITQLPPVRSAVKRRLRSRDIYYMEIMEHDSQYVLFKIGCQAGTYIRKLVHDFGKQLGVNAHMVQLIRTRVGPFNLHDSYTLHDIKDAYENYKESNETTLKKIILPIEHAVEHLPKIWVFDNTVDAVCHGSNIFVTGISKLHSNIIRHDLVAIMTLKDELIGIGEAEVDSEKLLTKGKGLGVKIKKVFMERGTYPKLKKLRSD